MQRVAVVEASIRLQASLGVTHLQQVEQAPAAFGLPDAARTPVRALRRRRNQALHNMADTPSTTAPTECEGQNIQGLNKPNTPTSGEVSVYKKHTTFGQTKELSAQTQVLHIPDENKGRLQPDCQKEVLSQSPFRKCPYIWRWHHRWPEKGAHRADPIA